MTTHVLAQGDEVACQAFQRIAFQVTAYQRRDLGLANAHGRCCLGLRQPAILDNQGMLGSRWLQAKDIEEMYHNYHVLQPEETIVVHAQEFSLN